MTEQSDTERDELLAQGRCPVKIIRSGQTVTCGARFDEPFSPDCDHEAEIYREMLAWLTSRGGSQ